MATQYTHAKDSLIEFAQKSQTKGWLKDLIIKVITRNGNLTGQDILDSTNQLKGNGASTLAIPVTSQANDNTEIKFVELKHNHGVCALADNQVIKFSDQITLLYGSNGSGKSSYFRVLNEIIGGNRHTPIVSNIYVENPSPINVDIVFSSNGIQHTINL